MTDRDELLSGVNDLLTVIKPWLGQVAILNWDGTQGFLPIVRRSILIRQAEALGIICELVQRATGSAAVPLVRPAAEELLWLKYLEAVPPRDADELADSLIQAGLLHDLEAQAGEVGDDEMRAMGLMPHLLAFRTRESGIQTRLRRLGRRLGWPERTTRDGRVPSVWFIATKTDSQRLYRFLYHATSRYVHFSPVELARRGWGRPGRLELSSHTYEPVWAAFALTWGARIFGLTLATALDALKGEGLQEPDNDGLQRAFDRITAVRMFPLVTPDELVWNATPSGVPRDRLTQE